MRRFFQKIPEALKHIVSYCYEKDVKIVPQGGNTSLTGASVPTYNNQRNYNQFFKNE